MKGTPLYQGIEIWLPGDDCSSIGDSYDMEGEKIALDGV